MWPLKVATMLTNRDQRAKKTAAWHCPRGSTTGARRRPKPLSPKVPADSGRRALTLSCDCRSWTGSLIRTSPRDGKCTVTLRWEALRRPTRRFRCSRRSIGMVRDSGPTKAVSKKRLEDTRTGHPPGLPFFSICSQTPIFIPPAPDRCR